MDERLIEAAGNVDVSAYEILNEAVKSEFFKSVISTDADEGRGNMFHIAAFFNNQKFMHAALDKLPEDVVHFLLCQRSKDVNYLNPIHVAAWQGVTPILEVLIEFYSREDRGVSVGLEPWLAQDEDGKTPLHHLLENRFEMVCLKVLSLGDVHKILMIDDNQGRGPLFVAVEKGLNRVIDYILRSTSPYSLSGETGMNILTYAPNCSDDICSRLIHQHFSLLDEEHTLNTWAKIGKVHPLKLVLEGGFVPSDLKKKFIAQLEVLNKEWGNALHAVSSIEVAKILVEAYKLERPEAQKSSLPWFQKYDKKTPLGMAINNRNEELALYFLGLDSVYFVTQNHEDDLLYMAIEKGCSEVAQEILDIVEQHNFSQRLIIGRTILHIAPNCKDPILRRLLKNYPQLIDETKFGGRNVLHSWIQAGKLWPFELILKDPLRRDFLGKLAQYDSYKMKPLHELDDLTTDIVNLLLDAWYQENFSATMNWSGKDIRGYTPMSKALSKGKEQLALCFSSWSKFYDLTDEEVGDALFMAVDHNFQQFVKDILERIQIISNYRTTDCLCSGGKNVLHVGYKFIDQENCKFIMERWHGLIYDQDEDGKTPLERASENGATWLVELFLQKDRTLIIKTPLAWVEACNHGHVGTVLAFAEKSPYFRNLCRQYCDTPLHHFKDLSFNDYQKLLEDKSINELKNIQNSKGETPLHTAIRNENKNLTEILLTMVDVDRTVKDHKDKTSMDLLQEKCDSDYEWSRMCQVIGVDPKLKTMYIQNTTNLSDTRNIVSLVAALLATITFTAGFTVPGGLNSAGEPVLVTKAVFLVFLISNTYAMCCAMLILFCITWSMVCDRDKSSLLLDRSLVLLKQSLYGTLLAFMTGIYATISNKSLWAAILVIYMCAIVVITADKTILCKVLPVLIPAAEKEYRLVEFLQCRSGKKKKEKVEEAATPPNIENTVEQQEALELSNTKGVVGHSSVV